MRLNNVINQLLILFVIFPAIQLSAQETPKDELYLLHQDIIKIDKVEEYEKIGKELFDVFRKYGMEGSVKYASKTDDNKYNYLSPLNSYSDLDNRDKHWASLAEKAGPETLSNIFSRMDETYVSHRDYIIRKSVDLSYVPENDRLEGEKAKFLHFDHYYFKDGKLNEGLKMMKEFKELMIKNNSTDGYNVWIFDIGEEYGHVVVTRLAKDGADYYQEANKRMTSMAEELKEMWPKFSSLLKHFDHNNGSRMPDFIYHPEK